MPTKDFKYLRPLKFDRYIIEEILGTFFGACIFILFVLLMFLALRLAEIFIVHGVPGNILLKMMLFMSLSFLPIALPLAFLIAILVAFGRLSSDSELIAMKASGISAARLSAAAWILAVAVVLLSIA